jgi:polar amino acid transport system substrate-binding protein
MADGTLEATFRRWNVWDADQARHFARVLAQQPATDARPRSAAPSTMQAMRAYLPALIKGAGLTLAISIAAMALAVVLGSTIAAGRVYGDRLTRLLLTAYVELVRGTTA